jgi:hypothetical protein
MVMFTVACVELVTVVELTVMPAPKLACVAPWSQFVNLPVTVTERVWAAEPTVGLMLESVAGGLTVRAAVLELAKATFAEVVPAREML